PPFFAPAIALCSCNASPKNASEPKVSERKIRRPSSSMRWACRAICRSFSECGFRAASRSSPPHPSPTTRASPIKTETATGHIPLCLIRRLLISRQLLLDEAQASDVLVLGEAELHSPARTSAHYGAPQKDNPLN